MFGSTVLEIAIGLAFVFFILSLVASAFAEAISQALEWRSKNLEAGIENLLADKAFAQKIYAHPLVRGMYRDKRKPSYLPAQIFTTVVLDLEATLGEGEIPPQVRDALRVFRKQFPGPGRNVEAAVEQVAATVKEVREAVEDWFDQSMDRVSGWYKRKLQFALWIIGLGTAAAVNGDTIAIVDGLSKDQALRASIVAAASQQVAAGVDASAPDSARSVSIDDHMTRAADNVQRVRGLGIPLGWGNLPEQRGLGWWASKIVGLLLTGAAVSLGAPFWFSTLNKLVNLRGAGNSPKRGQDDRMASAPGSG